MPTLNLPPGPYAAVWEVIRDRIEANEVLKASGVEILCLDGETSSLSDLETHREKGAVLFIPGFQSAQWSDESATVVALAVKVRAILPAADSIDHLNLQSALEKAIVSTADSGYMTALENAGAETGLVLFSSPLNAIATPEGKDNCLRLGGQITIDVRNTA